MPGGRSAGRSKSKGRGAPRGGPPRGVQRGRGGGRGRGRGRGIGLEFIDELDYPVQIWPDNLNTEYNSARGRGRGRGSPPSHQNSNPATPRGRGRGELNRQSPRGGGGRGRGRGRGSSRLHPDAPLSKLLYEERPLLRPVIFVRSTHTRTLFEEQEDLLQPVVEDVGEAEENHVPTANRVTRVFSGQDIPPMDESASSEESEIEEIDFEDLARIREAVDAAAINSTAPNSLGATDATVVEEQFTGSFVDTIPASINSPSAAVDATATPPPPSDGLDTADVTAIQQQFKGFFIDTTPTSLSSPSAAENVAVDRVGVDAPLGDAMEEEEIIVYVAPHPRSGKATIAPSEPPILPLPSTSMLTGTSRTITADSTPTREDDSQPRSSIPPAPAFDSVSFSFAASPTPRKQTRQAPVFPVGGKAKMKAKARKKDARTARRRLERQAMFGSFGAIMSEAQLRGDDGGGGKQDPKWEERRRGDSDIDWGDGDSDAGAGEDGVDEVSNELGGMELDPELAMDVAAMQGFVNGMGVNGGKHVTMGDIADEERMRMEDEDEGGSRGSSGDEEEEAVLDEEERMMMAEERDKFVGIDDDDDEDEDDEDSSEDGASPRASFAARLERMRQNAQDRRVVNKLSGADVDSSDDDDGSPTWADKDDDLFAQIETILEEHDKVAAGGRDRQENGRFFAAVHNGDFRDMEGISPAKRRKDKDVPPDLQDQWDKDRAKKAEHRRARAQARLEAAADPLAQKPGGKKGRKAMLKAAQLDPSVSVPNRVVDLRTLEGQIRRFLADIGGRTTMALPPMEKEARKTVHELADAFGLRSQSKGSGKGRYTTLIKTTRSGVEVREKKVSKIMRQNDGRGGFSGPYSKDKGKGKVVMPRHKEGEEVGKAAPKIGEANIGFKMLASMGWSVGDRIGASAGGLEVPLIAVIKNTKLGLGAAR